MPTALSGLLVLDMTRVVAGPLATQTLGDLGADVIKIERRAEGDDVRRVGPPWLPDTSGATTDQSTYFLSVNRNKRSLTVDFTTAEGAELIRSIAAKADVFVENYRVGTLAKYGLGYEDLKAINPRLVYCSVTGFGQTGPYASRSGYDLLVQAMGGMMGVTGLPEGVQGSEPMRVGVPIADICTGLNAAIGILAALRYRDETGQGQHVDVSLLESQIAAMLNPFSAWFNGGVQIKRTGNEHPSASPYGVYRASDGYMLIATFNDREFARLADAVGHSEWKTDPRFAKSGERVANRPALAELLTEALACRTRDEWVDLLNAATVSCGPINDMKDIEKDAQILAREVVVSVPHRLAGKVKVAASPIHLSDTPVTYRCGPPLAGQDTDALLTEFLGLGASDIAALRARDII